MRIHTASIWVLVSLLSYSAGQEDTTGTDLTTTTQGVDWDLPTRPRAVRYGTPRSNSDYASLYEAQMMMAQRPYGSRIQSPPPPPPPREVLEFFPFLRQPDAMMNFTRNSEDMRRYYPYHPGMFYPRPDGAEILRYTVDADPIRTNSLEEADEKQNISASSPSPYVLDVPSSRMDFPSYPAAFGYPYPPDYFLQRGSLPYGQPPVFYPPPRPDVPQLYPDFDGPAFPERELGPEPAETILPLKPEPVVPEPAVVPPRQPLPPPPYPFGLLPPQFLPPRLLPPAGPPSLPPPPVPEVPGEVIAPPPAAIPPVLPPPEAAEGVVKPPPEPPLNPALGQEGPKTPYEFGYDMNDGRGTDQHRQEISDGSGSVSGSYGYRDANGVYRVVTYVADKNGFRAVVKSNEPGVANPGSADVVVVAEVPPPAAVAEGLRATRIDAVEIPDIPVDLLPEASEIINN